MNRGKVYLVGAGPGDPGLITVKGLKCIESSHVIIYDHLAVKSLLSYAGLDAETIYVGKKAGIHTKSQDEINRLIVEKALDGRTVTRLKGGDPFVFGRGGEEARELIRHGIPFEVVPGVTSGIAAPAYAGIPLTHRDAAASVAFITGQEKPGRKTSRIDWKSLSRGIDTLVFFMGVKKLPEIARNLTAQGKPAETPVALIRWGTTHRQVVVTGDLGNIVEKARMADIRPPAIIIVGEVVRLSDTLTWFDPASHLI